MPHSPARARTGVSAGTHTAGADRREGGRHGKGGGRTGPPTAATGVPLLRLTVLPATAVALCAGLTLLYAVHLARRSGSVPGGVLIGGAVGTAAILAVATVAAHRAARALRQRILTLRRRTVRGQAELRELVESLRRGETPPSSAAGKAGEARPAGGAPEPTVPRGAWRQFDLLAGELGRAHGAAFRAVVQAAQLSRGGHGAAGSSGAGHCGGGAGGASGTGGAAASRGETDPSQHVVDACVHVARRLQSLVHREISVLDALESDIEDPDLLTYLFQVDHLATRMRRHAESLAVLGGASARRQWSRPVPVLDVLRSAVAEVEQYPRVRLVPPIEGSVHGHAVADVVHLLAELIENATTFSAPHAPVLLRVAAVATGLAIEVEDRGPGLPAREQARMNSLLADPARIQGARLLPEGRIGLYVASRLARRHGIPVRLQTNIYGGTQAVLVLPRSLLGTEAPEVGRPATAGAGATAAPPEAGQDGRTPEGRAARGYGDGTRGHGTAPAYAGASGQAHTGGHVGERAGAHAGEQAGGHGPGHDAGHARGRTAGHATGHTAGGPAKHPERQHAAETTTPPYGLVSIPHVPAQGAIYSRSGSPRSPRSPRSSRSPGSPAAPGSLRSPEITATPGSASPPSPVPAPPPVSVAASPCTAASGSGSAVASVSSSASSSASAWSAAAAAAAAECAAASPRASASVSGAVPDSAARRSAPAVPVFVPVQAAPSASVSDLKAGHVNGHRPARSRLPSRRATEHTTPPCGDGSAARQGDEAVSRRNPGLMAAFRRGIDRAGPQLRGTTRGEQGIAAVSVPEGAVSVPEPSRRSDGT